ncbi:hypothetical protein [uncultured Nostoc sp.]|uniref:hypothetical protein n=1 Tax=uncultured Nostoc sp. TaxID=340711 RepID=UPI0035CA97EA
MNSSFIYITRIRYSKDSEQTATAVKDASNCGCQECDRVPALSGGDYLCLVPGEKPSDCYCLNQMAHEYIDAQKLSL